jgi:competence protein CoiA
MGETLFVAMMENGERLSLLEQKSLTEWRRLRKDNKFFCPICGQEVVMKIGEKRIPHFAHMKVSNCSIILERESPIHLLGKKRMYDWFHHQRLPVQLEPYLPFIRQRPDLLVQWERDRYAIEFQCSKIEQQLFIERTKSYQKNRISPIWIAGAAHLTKISPERFRMSEFQWLFVHSLGQDPKIIYFCPETSRFHILSNLFPISPKELFASHSFINMYDVTFPELISYSITNWKFPIKCWLQQKKKKRWQLSFYPQKQTKLLLQRLYLQRISPSCFPAEAGIPVKSMYWLETSPVIWQLWLLLDVIFPVPIGHTIQFQEGYHSLLRKIRKGVIKKRNLPLMKESHFSFAVMEYFQMLSKLGILKRTGSQTFEKKKEISIPLSMEEAMEKDLQVMKTLW